MNTTAERMIALTEMLMDADFTPVEDSMQTPFGREAIVAERPGMRVLVFPGDDCSVELHGLSTDGRGRGVTEWSANFTGSVPVAVIAAAVNAA